MLKGAPRKQSGTLPNFNMEKPPGSLVLPTGVSPSLLCTADFQQSGTRLLSSISVPFSQVVRLSQREGTHRRGPMESMPAGADGRTILWGSLGGSLLDMSLEGRQEETDWQGRSGHRETWEVLQQQRVAQAGGTSWWVSSLWNPDVLWVFKAEAGPWEEEGTLINDTPGEAEGVYTTPQ